MIKKQHLIIVLILFFLNHLEAQNNNKIFDSKELKSLSIDELKVLKRKLLRQKKYQESDKVDVVIKNKYKTSYETKETSLKIIAKPTPKIEKTKLPILVNKISETIATLPSENKAKHIVIKRSNQNDRSKPTSKIKKTKLPVLVNKISETIATLPSEDKEKLIITKNSNQNDRSKPTSKIKKTKLPVLVNKISETIATLPSEGKEKLIITKNSNQNDRSKSTPQIIKKLSKPEDKILDTSKIKDSLYSIKEVEKNPLKKTKVTHKNLINQSNTKPKNEKTGNSVKTPKEIVKKENSINLELTDSEIILNLEKKQKVAISGREYLEANTLENQIQAFKEKKKQLEKLKKQLEESVNKKEFVLADKLNKKIQIIKKQSFLETIHTNIKKEESEEKPKTKIDAKPSIINKENNNSLKTLTKTAKNETNNGLEPLLTKTSNSSKSVESYTTNSKSKKSKISKHSSNKSEINYRRSSLFTLMIENTKREHSDIIRSTFESQPIPEKFNNHNLNKNLIYSNIIKKDQSRTITDYLNTNDIAKKMIAKWFNRNEKGEFNMDLISERGNYNATDLDVVIARSTERGEAMLADAGEELIGNTFIIVNDYKYTNKEKIAKKTGGFLKALSAVAAYVPGGNTISTAATYTNVAVQVAGKGYVIKTTSYLYKLVWDEKTAATFYNDYWIDESNYNESKKQAFEQSNIFKLKYVGQQNAWADIQSSAFSHKSNEQLIKRATVKATNKAIAKLQRKYDKFKTKSPIIGVNPVSAKIGLKEGLTKGDKYEILEQVLNKKGKTVYKRVGVVRVDKRHIWDNRFMANKENHTKYEYTTFKGIAKKAQVGMFLRQLK